MLQCQQFSLLLIRTVVNCQLVINLCKAKLKEIRNKTYREILVLAISLPWWAFSGHIGIQIKSSYYHIITNIIIINIIINIIIIWY